MVWRLAATTLPEVRRPLEAHRINYSQLQLLGDSAAAFVNALKRDERVHPEADHILQATEEELDLGLAAGFYSRGEMDRRFGRGQWRPLPPKRGLSGRHIQTNRRRTQGGAQQRGSHGREDCVRLGRGHPTRGAPAGSRVHRLRESPLPLRAQLGFGTEDFTEGFRQLRSTAADVHYCGVTFVHPKQRHQVCAVLRGLPFAVGSVVN